MSEDAAAAGPVLIDLLNAGDVHDRKMAALTLGKISRTSQNAIPALFTTSKDEEDDEEDEDEVDEDLDEDFNDDEDFEDDEGLHDDEDFEDDDADEDEEEDDISDLAIWTLGHFDSADVPKRAA